MIIKVLILGAIIYYLRVTIKKINKNQENYERENSKKDTFEADYEIID